MKNEINKKVNEITAEIAQLSRISPSDKGYVTALIRKHQLIKERDLLTPALVEEALAPKKEIKFVEEAFEVEAATWNNPSENESIWASLYDDGSANIGCSEPHIDIDLSKKQMESISWDDIVNFVQKIPVDDLYDVSDDTITEML